VSSAWTIYLAQDLGFRNPVGLADTINVTVTARERRLEKHVVVFDYHCVNQPPGRGDHRHGDNDGADREDQAPPRARRNRCSYALQLVSIPKGQQQAPEYLNVNPRGKIPALRAGDGVLTENVAILTYVARSFPQARLLREEPTDMARCISQMAPGCRTRWALPKSFAQDPSRAMKPRTRI
jgi:Glutathione S-transferase, N-terminal domain